MKRLPVVFVILCVLCLLTGCEILHHSTKYNFASGFYFSRLHTGELKKYYIVTDGDSIKVYPAHIAMQIADTVKSITVLFPPNKKPSAFSDYSFKAESFDLDVFTILFKYRPPVAGFPNQFNTNFNGALYAGYRTDIFKLSYKENPLHIANRDITHYGYSVGGFIGAGAARIDEYVTLGRINYEYDGTIITGGLAGEFGIDKLNFGLTFGLDYLTDKNRHVWVNETKPWVGLSLGLNLN